MDLYEEIKGLKLKQRKVKNRKRFEKACGNAIGVRNDFKVILNIKTKHEHERVVKPGKLNGSEDFVNLVKAINLKTRVRIIERKGKGAHKGFLQEDQTKGDLGNDCLRFPEKQRYFKLITKNPKQLSILYIYDDTISENNGYAGFTILYHIKDEVYYDRIYGYSEAHAMVLEDHCINNGYKNCFYVSDYQLPKLKVKLEKYNFKYYPYMDALHYLDDKGFLRSKRKSRDDKELRCHQGSYH